MLIDAFAEDWFDTLRSRATDTSPSCATYLLLDGAFVPGLHKSLRKEGKALLFAALPGYTEEAEDASPFLTPFVPGDRILRALLQRCNRWPMVSVIETPESLEQLADRLAAWCVVEADGQRFNFRFTDTRRFPAIFEALSPLQRAKMTGPAKHWSHVGRGGRWRELELPNHGADGVAAPELDQYQFAFLVSDSRADEILMLLADRGVKAFKHPSRSHALVMIALRAAHAAQLPENALLDWCEWFWRQDNLDDDSSALAALNKRRTDLARRD